jgi:hypothetical protein
MNTNDWIDLLARHEGPVDRHVGQAPGCCTAWWLARRGADDSGHLRCTQRPGRGHPHATVLGQGCTARQPGAARVVVDPAAGLGRV